MRLLRLLSPIVVAAGISLATSVPAVASCAQQTTAEQVARAQIVAYGSVTGIRMTFAPASPVVTFRPERVLKGSLDKSVEVFLGPTHGGAVTSVDYAAAPPQRHTLYLRVGADGSYETDVCSGSHEGAPTADEEKILGAGTSVNVVEDFPLVVALAIGLGVALALAIAAVLVIRARA